MPDTQIIHWHPAANVGGRAVCEARSGGVTEQQGQVTCFACRNNTLFKQAQRGTPSLLREVLAESPDLAAINSKAWLARCRNHRGMFTIQEVIHHGNYRSERIVEVHDINETTVDAVLQSSAYCYGSWAHAEPQYAEHRAAALKQLVQDLRDGVTNRAIGWSTFRLIPNN